MRTKTLLIAAAALAAAVTSSNAQTVYSQNIVGYVNLGITANQFELYAPALDADGTGTNGTINSVVGTNVDVGTSVLVWNGTGFDSLSFENVGTRSAPQLAWVLGGVGTDPNYPLNVGQGFFIQDPGPNTTNITLTGVVVQGSAVADKHMGSAAGSFSLLGSVVPFAGDLDTNLNYVPSTGDSVLTWNGNGFNSYSYENVGTRSAPQLAWVLGGVGQQDPQISVGQGFFLQPANANATWSETFTNN